MTDTASAAPSLLPCPFCGGTARRSTGGEGVKAWYGTGCGGSQSCPAYLHGLMHRTQAQADAAWNRRAQPTPPAVVEPPHQPKRTVTYVCPVCAASLERQE